MGIARALAVKPTSMMHLYREINMKRNVGKRALHKGKTAGTLFSALMLSGWPILASGVTLEELADKVETLARENRELREQVRQLQQRQQAGAVIREDLAAVAEQRALPDPSEDLLVADHEFSYHLLDPTRDINRKQLYLLERKADRSKVYVGAALTAIADYQRSSHENKFGYLMRHPTASNQRTESVSEAVIHSAQVQLTAELGAWTTGYIEMLYDPEQSFGAGTITDLNRNQVQVRKGYVIFGNLDESPLYLSLGKMDIPFGLMDTYNPFTASTVWHAFGGLAYGLQGGYYGEGVSVRAMAVQGGAQFRAANVPVDGSNVPSKLNNYAIDASYQFPVAGSRGVGLLGASYIKGSAYCQAFPVTHFSACEEENGAYGIYGQLELGPWAAQAEYARTEEEWPGTFNPAIPQFAASKVTSWDIGGKYRTTLFALPTDLSLDFSRFDAGPDDSPWEKQDQIVLGVASFLHPTVKLFGEFVRVEGYAPLNFISGGNLPAGMTHSELDSFTNVFILGTNVAF